MKKIELLAPAGDFSCLKAAIEAGCDAVYLGGKMFGARSFAGNFSKEELIEAINYAHLYGVKVYLTVNTIIYEREVDSFVDFIRFAHQNNIDAVILQDIGMFDLLRKKFPKLELHASTQMNIHSYEGALLAKKLGFKRIVMARETPLPVIEKIKKEIDIEVEVFIHGALCVSYSGCCLMSALIGNRSGNRGTCAQVCRKKYNLYDEKGNKLNRDNYLLSTKDLCTLENLDEIINSGADSLKIEGRMKRAEYVYLVTKIYRKAIDNYYKYGKTNITSDDVLEIKKIFNRDFTKGFMLGEDNNSFTYSKRPNHKGIEVGKVISKINNDLKIKLDGTLNLHDGLRIIDDKEDKGLIVNKMFINKKEVNAAKKGDIITIKYDKFVKEGSIVLLTTDYSQVNKIQNNLKNIKRKVYIDVFVKAKENDNLIIRVSDGVNTVEERADNTIEKANNTATTKELLIKQISKTGNTIYEIKNINIDVDDNIFVNIKDINELRRKVLEELNKKRLYKIAYVENDYYIDLVDYKKENKRCVLVNDKEEYEKYKDKYDVIYTTDKSLIKNCILKLPRISNLYYDTNNTCLIGEFGSILKYKNFETDFSFNVVNSYSLAFLHSLGAKCVTLSFELNLKQIENIINEYNKRYNKHPNVQVIINSYPEAMVSRFDLNKLYNTNISYLKDKFSNKYKVISHDCYMTIYNYKKVNEIDEEEYFKIGVNSIRINL